MKKETYGKLENVLLKAGSAIGVAGAGSAAGFAIAQDGDWLRNVAISAAAGAIGLCIRYVGSLAGDCRRAMEFYDNVEKISKEVEDIARENMRMGLPADTRPEDRGRVRAAQYARRENA